MLNFSSLTAAARALGGEVSGRQIRCPGPGHSRTDRSLVVRFDERAPGGFVVFSFANDDDLACKDYARERLGLPPWRQTEKRRSKDQSPRIVVDDATINGFEGGAQRVEAGHAAERRQKAQWLWQASKPAQGTLVETYLRSRGIALPVLPTTIRYLPATPPKHQHPAMIAPFTDADEPEPGRLAVTRDAIRGVHLTFLRPDGCGKAGAGCDKIMVGRSSGTPVVVAPISDGLGLAITEGIEDALSVHVMAGLGAWAAGSASRLPALADAVPSYTDAVTIVADGDDAGQRGAHELANRLRHRGIEVIVSTPAYGERGAAA